MLYRKTVNLWDSTIQKAILSGELVLQAGQWCQCGQGKRSRFVAVKKETLWVAHWQGSGKASNLRFLSLLKSSK